MKTCRGKGKKSHKKYIYLINQEVLKRRRVGIRGFGIFGQDQKAVQKLYIIPSCNQRVNYKGRSLCQKTAKLASGPENKVMRNNPRFVITHTPVHREKKPSPARRPTPCATQKPNIAEGRGRLENAKWKVESGKRSHDMETGYLHSVQYLLTVCGCLLNLVHVIRARQ